jgi:uncharacterized protein (DUF427 family)
VPERVRVVVAGRVVADSRSAQRVLETSHPPNYYLPPADVDWALLRTTCETSFCEWKGRARYFDIVVPEQDGVDRRQSVAWAYPDPSPRFAALRHHVAFYAGRVDEAWVGEERATPQPGGFYGGWITSRVVGPFKGAPGTMGW